MKTAWKGHKNRDVDVFLKDVLSEKSIIKDLKGNIIVLINNNISSNSIIEWPNHFIFHSNEIFLLHCQFNPLKNVLCVFL